MYPKRGEEPRERDDTEEKECIEGWGKRRVESPDKRV